MSRKKSNLEQLHAIIDAASARVAKWPEWMRSPENRYPVPKSANTKTKGATKCRVR